MENSACVEVTRQRPIGRKGSRQLRRRARLFRGAGTGCGSLERKFVPDHGGDLAVEGEDGCGPRRVDGCAGMQYAAKGTAAPLSALRAGVIILAGPGGG